MRSITSVLLALIFVRHSTARSTTQVAHARNLLLNPGFEHGAEAWSAEGAVERYKVVSGAGRNNTTVLCYRLTPQGTIDKENSHWDQQVVLRPGMLYIAAVRVRGDGVAYPTLRIADDAWTTLALARERSGTDWQRVQVLFRAPQDGKVRFQLFGGGNCNNFRAMQPGVCWFDDALLCEAASAPDLRTSCRVSVNAQTRGRRINPLFFGVNSLFMIEDDAALADPRLADCLHKLPCRLIRFPGGEMADNYHWKTQTLDNPKKWPFRGGPETTDTDEFMAWCRTIGAEPIIVVNLESWAARRDIAGGAQEAAAWVRYCNVEKKYRVRYWEVGNETYLKGTFHPMTARQYAEAFVQYAKAMKAMDPTIIVGAVGPRGIDEIAAVEKSEPTARPWWPTVAEKAGRLLEMAVVHQYIRVPSSREMPWTDLSAGPDKVRELRKFLDAAPGTRHTLIALTEWNIAGPNSTDEARVPHLAELIGRYLTAGVDLAAFWPLRISPKSRKWGRNALVAFEEKSPMPAYAALHLFAQYAVGHVAETTVSGSVTIRAFACIDLATRRLRLFVIDKATQNNVDHVEIEVDGLPATLRFEHGQILTTDTAPESTVRLSSARAVRLRDGPGWHWPISPLSVSLLQFRW